MDSPGFSATPQTLVHPAPAIDDANMPEISRPRILIATPLGAVIEPQLDDFFPSCAVTIAADEDRIRAAIDCNVRFDVVLTDLLWNNVAVEHDFDGLDVLEMLNKLDRAAPVVFALQGHSGERDHLDEALAREHVAGWMTKSSGLGRIAAQVLKIAKRGGKLNSEVLRRPSPTIYEYFTLRRNGRSAARFAGAIASGQACNSETLAEVVGVPVSTAKKMTERHLGPIIRERKEYPDHLPITSEVAYRWCGAHANYIISYCRRKDFRDVMTAPESLVRRWLNSPAG